jgi:cupin 2 domain-containing protein
LRNEGLAKQDLAKQALAKNVAAFLLRRLDCGSGAERRRARPALQPESELVINLLDDLPAHTHEESFTEVMSRPHLRIERIVSTGQSTPTDQPYRQEHDEWVLLLAGAAGLRIEGEGERDLRPGDHVLIPAHRQHWVTWTARDAPTIWLAIHFH